MSRTIMSCLFFSSPLYNIDNIVIYMNIFQICHYKRSVKVKFVVVLIFTVDRFLCIFLNKNSIKLNIYKNKALLQVTNDFIATNKKMLL